MMRSTLKHFTNTGAVLITPFLVWSFLFNLGNGQSYSSTLSLFDSVLGNNSAYNTRIRPLTDQSQVINVSVEFSLIAILTMDDKRQEFITNGFLGLTWTDQVVPWNPWGNRIYVMNVYPNDIWRPRLVLLNTLGDRDLFEDDYRYKN
ncbi:neuronal acetylcholine receptor subunit alpha-6 [Elysia marginata]|uniref:Neuronal acetylcholine receptor subunit alpha-6 n=1 Tax=Elysia marginata TaxID=1093978 RepID=A0AAV4GLB2_9GAST|nr:neuronal acetylcholine receptor subunit alpha-6 [Elysia marginata]